MLTWHLVHFIYLFYINWFSEEKITFKLKVLLPYRTLVLYPSNFEVLFQDSLFHWLYTFVCVCVLRCRFWLFATPWTVACQAPLSMESSRQEYWSGLPFPTRADLPNLGIETTSNQIKPTLHQISNPASSLINKLNEYPYELTFWKLYFETCITNYHHHQHPWLKTGQDGVWSSFMPGYSQDLSWSRK